MIAFLIVYYFIVFIVGIIVSPVLVFAKFAGWDERKTLQAIGCLMTI